MKLVEMNSDIAENEMIFTIVKCIGVAPIVKDNKTFVEYEMPFPHVSLYFFYFTMSSLDCICLYLKYIYLQRLVNFTVIINFNNINISC